MKKCNAGRIHSIETLGALDGPGLRTVVFMQGCPLRCRYCHNPDTWEFGNGEEMTAEQVLQKIMRFRPYTKNGGGVTVSGGEPMAQADFVLELLELCCNEGIHTAIDTGGGCFSPKVCQIIDKADLVILDVKHSDPAEFEKLTGGKFSIFNELLKECETKEKAVWIRQVIVPGITDSKEQIEALGDLVKGLNIKKAELLSYHDHGIHKWDKLGIDYTLRETQIPSQDTIEYLQEILDKKLKD